MAWRLGWQLDHRPSHAQVVQRARHPLSALLEDVGIDHGGLEIVVPQQLLNGSYVGSALQQMGGKGVAESVGTHVFGQARPPHAGFNGLVDDTGIDVVATRDARTWVYRHV